MSILCGLTTMFAVASGMAGFAATMAWAGVAADDVSRRLAWVLTGVAFVFVCTAAFLHGAGVCS